MLLKKFFVIVVFLALTSLGSTIPPNIASELPPNTLQKLDGLLSQACTTTLLSLIVSPGFLQCVPVSAFVPLLPIVTDPNFISSIKQNPKNILKYLPQLDQFSDILCSAPKCSDDGVKNATQTIANGCKEDLGKNNTLAELIFGFAVFYSPVRDITCFKDKNAKNAYCKDETANVILNLPNSPINITGNPILDAVAVADPGQVCTQCNRDIVNTLFNFLKNNELAFKVLAQLGIDQAHVDGMKVGVAVKCGINFENGTVPDLPPH